MLELLKIQLEQYFKKYNKVSSFHFYVNEDKKEVDINITLKAT